MTWIVRFHEEFEEDFGDLREAVQEELLAIARILADFGPQLGRPHADTLKGSAFANMKELRFAVDNGVWRVAYAFDWKREGILLIAGDKSGKGEAKFYKRLIRKADERYRRHLKALQVAAGKVK